MFGTSPPTSVCARRGLDPASQLDSRALRAMLSTGSVLHDAVRLGARHVKPVRSSRSPAAPTSSAASCSATRTCRSIAGEAQCRSLGLDVQALPAPTASRTSASWSARNPFPSRPLGFFGDRRRALPRGLFRPEPGRVDARRPHRDHARGGTARLHGRSDGVLNVRGIRIGPAEIYRILATSPRSTRRWSSSSKRPRRRRARDGSARGTCDGQAARSSAPCRTRRSLARAHAGPRAGLIVEVAELP